MQIRRVWLAIVTLVVILHGVARADVLETSPGYFVAGVRTDRFQFLAAQGSQHRSNWCWAACVQMVLQYHGLRVTQEQIVQKVYGRLVDAPAGPQQVMYALNGWVPDTRGHRAQVRATSYGINEQTLIQDLSDARPLIVGLQGMPGNHAFVLTAIYFVRDPYGHLQPTGVVLRDPWPGNQSRQEWPWQQFTSRCTFVARVQVSHSAVPEGPMETQDE